MIANLESRFAVYDQLTADQRAAVDEMRCLPVPELRRLVNRAKWGAFAEDLSVRAERQRLEASRLVPLPGTVRTACGLVLG